MKISGTYDYKYNAERKWVEPLCGEYSTDIHSLYMDIKSYLDITLDIAMFLAWLPNIREITIGQHNDLYIIFANDATITIYNHSLAKYFLQEIEIKQGA